MLYLDFATDDIGEGYASNPTHAGQEGLRLVEGLCGRGHIKGLGRVVGLLIAKAPVVLKLLLGL